MIWLYILKGYIMSKKAPKSITANTKRAAHLFNHDHSRENPTTAREFEGHLRRWVESNNPGARATCELKRGSIEGVFVISIALEMVHVPKAWDEDVHTKIALFNIIRKTITYSYEEFVAKLEGVDLSRLDEITT
jgi:hypothetical protein